MIRPGSEPNHLPQLQLKNSMRDRTLSSEGDGSRDGKELMIGHGESTDIFDRCFLQEFYFDRAAGRAGTIAAQSGSSAKSCRQPGRRARSSAA